MEQQAVVSGGEQLTAALGETTSEHPGWLLAGPANPTGATVAATPIAPVAVPAGSRSQDEPTPQSRWAVLATGLAAMAVPMSLLKATNLVRFTGGRGMLPIADADTLFMDAALLTMIAIVFRRRRGLRISKEYAFFAILLAITTSVLMAYVVTNFGTMFRIRYMATVPMLALALAFAPARRDAELLEVHRQRDAGTVRPACSPKLITMRAEIACDLSTSDLVRRGTPARALTRGAMIAQMWLSGETPARKRSER